MSSGVVLVAGGQQPLRLHVGLLAPPPASARQAHRPPSPARRFVGRPSLRDGHFPRRIRRVVKPRHNLDIQRHIPVAIVRPRLVGRALRYPPSQRRAAKRALCGLRAVSYGSFKTTVAVVPSTATLNPAVTSTPPTKTFTSSTCLGFALFPTASDERTW